jgi:amino acid adenylation domain-containing protein
LWADVLGIGEGLIGVHDNFFQLGGHSLKAVNLVSRIHKEFSVEVPVMEFFKIPTIRAIAAYIQQSGKEDYAAIRVVEKREYYPLSSAQKRLYILQQMALESTAYNMPVLLELTSTVDLERLETGIRLLIRRHESFRTSFHMIHDEPVQKIQKDPPFKIEYHELGEGEQILEPRFFDLSTAPLLRVGLIKTRSGTQWLQLDMHHIIMDGVSVNILIRDFAAGYLEETLTPLQFQYKDYVKWQHSRVQQNLLKKQEAYWLKVFEEAAPPLDLPVDYPRSPIQGFEGDTLDFEIDSATTAHLKKLALDHGMSLFMILLALYNILLAKLSNREDIVLGTPIAGRRHAEIQEIIGVFINTLALRNYPGGGKWFLDFLKEIKETALYAFENQEYPFEELVEKLEVNRDINRNPLFDVMFVFQNMANAQMEIPGFKMMPNTYETRTAKFDLTLMAIEEGEKLVFTFTYSTKLFSSATISRFINYFKKIITGIVAQPEIKISGIEILSGNEKREILSDFNNTATDYAKDKSIHRLFEEQVEKNPGRLAVLANKQLTYGELDEASRRLATLLRAKGVKTGSVVALMAERSVEAIIGIFAILKAGGAYLPIDPGYPVNRIRFILKDCDTGILLTHLSADDDARFRDSLDFFGNGNILSISAELFEPAPTSAPLAAPCTGNINPAQDSAYIIYTSGTTGTPKGVIITHRSVVNLVTGLNEKIYKDVPPVNVALLAPFVFDASIKQIFPALLLGHTLAIVPEDTRLDGEALLSFYRENKIWCSDATPAHLSILLNYYDQLSTHFPVQRLIVGGQELDINLCRQFFSSLTNDKFQLINVYGPTECCDIATLFTVTPESLQQYRRIPIGKPIGNAAVYILGPYGEIRPLGVPGELCIAGDGVGKGYVNRPGLTAEKFTPMPSLKAGDAGDVLIYHSGDLARWLEDGNIEFLGRIDDQIKIRGFRVEPAEIERQLTGHPGVKFCVVKAWGNVVDGETLCAYIVGVKDLSVSEIREYLASYLPDYMVPSSFMMLDELPLTASGKVDRRGLPEPEKGSDSDTYAAPRDNVEKVLVSLWAEILDIPPHRVSIDADFFHLGGHSLKATIMLAKIHKAFSKKITLVDIFHSPTIRGIAKGIRQNEDNRYIPITHAEPAPYYPLSSAQKQLYVLQQMDLESTGYNIPLTVILAGQLDKNRLTQCVRILIRRHESLRTSFHMQDGDPLQKIHDAVEFAIHEEVVPGNEYPDISSFIRPFDLSQAPLLRVTLIKRTELEHLLIVDMHHIITDGISMNIFIKEILAIYAGEQLPPLEFQYKDYSQWQAGPLQQEKIESQREFWLNRFTGEIPVLNLPLDYTRPAIQSFAGSMKTFEIPDSYYQLLKELSQRTGTTTYILLLAIFNVFLSKLTGQEDIVVGVDVAGRPAVELHNIIGMFINTLALRNAPLGEKTFLAFLEEVKKSTLEAFDNQDYSFDRLVMELGVGGVADRNPLFDVMFSFQNIEDTQIAAGLSMNNEPGSNLEIKEYTYDNKTSKFDLTLSVTETTSGLSFCFEYSTALFRAETIDGFVNYFKEILASIVDEPGKKIPDIDVVGLETKKALFDHIKDEIGLSDLENIVVENDPIESEEVEFDF